MAPTGIVAEQQTSRRLFFALWPDDGVRQQLITVSKQCDKYNTGKPMIPMNLHLTLAFLGNVNEARVECLRDVAAKVRVRAFRLRLDTPGWFRKPRVGWIGTEQAPEQLLSLAAQLRAGSMQCGLLLDDSRFKPHVSLQRKVQRFQPFDVAPVEWDAHDFVLVQSYTHPEGVEYKVINRWPLLEESL